jgi:hypothetical protein
VGGHRPIVWGGELSDKKIYIIKYTAALNGRQSANQHTTTNQKQAAAAEGSMEGICDERDAWGTCDSIVLVAIRCKYNG